MYIIKYGNFYISFINYANFEFGVDTVDRAKTFINKDEVDNMVRLLGLGQFELIKI